MGASGVEPDERRPDVDDRPLRRRVAFLWLLIAVFSVAGGLAYYGANASSAAHLEVQLGGVERLVRGDLPRGAQPPPEYFVAAVQAAVPDVRTDFWLITGYGIALFFAARLARALFRTAEGQRLARAALPLGMAAVAADVVENIALLQADVTNVEWLLDLVAGAAVVKWVCLVPATIIAMTALLVTAARLLLHLEGRLKARPRICVLPPDPLDGDPRAPRAQEIPATGPVGQATVPSSPAPGGDAPMEPTRWRRGFGVPDLTGDTQAATQALLLKRGPVIGFCLSGGGIRSGSVALGALQSLRPELVKARYLVSVSGGGYTAGALQMALTGMDTPTRDAGDKVHQNPDDAYGPGSAEEDRFRRNVRYLAGSPQQIAVALGVVARGLVVSLLVLFAPAVVLGALLGYFYGNVPLAWPLGSTAEQAPDVREGTWWASAGLLALAFAVYAVALTRGLLLRRRLYDVHPGRRSSRWRRSWAHFTAALGWVSRKVTGTPPEEQSRQRLPGELLRKTGTVLTGLALLVLVLAVGLPWLVHLAGAVVEAARDADAPAVQVGGPVAGVVLTYVMTLASLLRRKKVVDKAGGLFGFRKNTDGKSSSPVAAIPGGALQLLLVVITVVLLAASWLFLAAGISAEAMAQEDLGVFWYTVAGIAAVLALLGGALDQTTLSLHPFYRRRLALAFASRRVTRREDQKVVAEPYRYDEVTALPRYGRRVVQGGKPVFPEVVFAAAANLTGEQRAPLDAASFTFTSRWLGGPDVGYAPTAQVYAAVGPAIQRDLTVQAAVAISGAAFASAMGRAGRWYGTLLAVSGLRLGTWLPNPAFLAEWARARTRPEQWTGPGLPRIRRLTYLFREVLGTHRYRDRLLQITDGGHYENLGLVETLRRRCTLVYCIDASGDRPPTAGTLEQAVTLAWQELGVFIGLPEDVWDLVPGSADPLDPDGPLAALNGRLSARNAVAALICYREASDMPMDLRHGLLVVGKALITPYMGYDVLSYAARNPVFPHDSTGDQFFTDPMFTAYAALGRQTGLAVRKAVWPAIDRLPERCPNCGCDSVTRDVRAALASLELPVEEEPAEEESVGTDPPVVETRLLVDGRLVLDSPSRRTVSLRERIRTALW